MAKIKKQFSGGRVYRVMKNNVTNLACERYETARAQFESLVTFHGGKEALKDANGDKWHGFGMTIEIR